MVIRDEIIILTIKFTWNFKGESKMAKIIIDYDECDACGECVDVCPMEVLIIVDGKLKVQHPEECNECEVCMDVCPNECIEVEED